MLQRDRSALKIALSVLLTLAIGLILPLGAAGGAAPAGESDPPVSGQGVNVNSVAYMPLILNNYAALFVPDDSRLDQQWYLTKVKATTAWGLTQGSSNVMIAILDTGADYDHPDLAGKLRTDLAKTYINGTNNANDDEGHGTHVSGLAAAAFNNGTGIAGLGGKATILPIKVLGSDGRGDFDVLPLAIRYAADHGAKVISMSLGNTSYNYNCAEDFPDLQNAIDYAYDKGILIVAAAGNEGTNHLVVPADCNHVIGVAATNSSDHYSMFSNFGSYVSVAAPGGDLYYYQGYYYMIDGLLSTCYDGDYCEMIGTSMATPLVAGLAALIYAKYPSYTPGQVASAILDNSVDLGPTGWDSDYGCGRIDAFASLSKGAKSAQPVCVGTNAWSASTQSLSRPYQAKEGYIPGELVVRFAEGVTQTEGESLLQGAGATLQAIDESGLWKTSLPAGQEQAAINILEADARVEYARPVYTFQAQ